MATGNGKGELLTTTKVNGHTHIVYASKQNPEINTTSIDKKHQHMVEGSLEEGLTLSSVDGHTHEIIELPFEDKKDKIDEDEVMRDLLELWECALKYEEEYRENGEESEEFRRGKMWSDSVLGKRSKNNKASHTIPLINSKINVLVGLQRQNRTSIKLLPTEGGDFSIVDILNGIIKYVLHRNDYQKVKSEVFEDLLISGRGNFHIYIDRTDNLEGEIRIEKFKWQDIVYGPHEDPYLKDCEYQIKMKWIDKLKLQKMYPKKSNEINEMSKNFEKGKYDFSHTLKENIINMDGVKVKLRLGEFSEKVYEEYNIAVNGFDGFVLDVSKLNSSLKGQIKSIESFNVVNRVKTNIQVTLFTGDIFLESFKSESKSFSVIPAYANKRGKHIWGKIEEVKEVQKEYNFRHSQLTEQVNHSAGGCKFIDGETFPNPKEKKKYMENANNPSAVIEVSNIGNLPSTGAQVQYPAALLNTLSIIENDIEKVMGVPAELEGQATNARSEVAILQRKQGGLLGNEYMFDNLRTSQKHLGTSLVEAIKEVYTPQRAARVLINQNVLKVVNGEEPTTVGVDKETGQYKLVTDYNPEDFFRVVNALWENEDLLKYDVQVEEANDSPNQRKADLALILQYGKDLFATHPELLPLIFLDLTDLHDKEKYMKMIQDAEAAAAQAAQADMEQKKEQTIIPAQIKAQTEMMKMQQKQQGGGQPQ